MEGGDDVLVGTSRQKINIPHEPGEWVEIRLLTGPEMDEASMAHTRKALSMMEGLSADTVAMMQEQARTSAASAATDDYDADALCQYAIVGWSYEQPAERDTIRQLDARTRDWLKGIIISMNVRPEGEGSGFGENSQRELSTEALSTPTDSA